MAQASNVSFFYLFFLFFLFFSLMLMVFYWCYCFGGHSVSAMSSGDNSVLCASTNNLVYLL